jgi:hypothetical protein
MKYLYKYPQAAYPYSDLVETSRRRGRHEFEYELIDTGVFDQDRYFDVFVEYAKESPEDLLIRISVHNRGPGLAEAGQMLQLDKQAALVETESTWGARLAARC